MAPGPADRGQRPDPDRGEAAADQPPDLAALTAKPAFCPFDAEHLETATVPFPVELTAEGRIRLGKAVVVPNIMAYATHSAVGIYDPGGTSSTWTS